MNKQLKDKTVELIKVAGTSLIQATLWLLTAVGALLELGARWAFYILEEAAGWVIKTAVPMAISGIVNTTIVVLDVSVVTIQFALEFFRRGKP